MSPTAQDRSSMDQDHAVLDQRPQQEEPSLDEAIQNLPPELSEKIYNEFVKIKLRERKEMGWNEVHNDIEEAPFCEKGLRITKVCYCRNCTSCRINKRCYECYKYKEIHYLDFPYPTYETYNATLSEILLSGGDITFAQRIILFTACYLLLIMW